MKKTIAILFFCLPVMVFSQDTLSKWSWGVMGGVERCGRILKDVNNDEESLKVWTDLEDNVWRLSGGMRIQRQLIGHFSVFSGLTYVDRGYRIDTLPNAGLNTLEYHFQYVEVPFGIAYSPAKNKKNSLLASASFITAFGLSNKLYYNKDGQTARFEMQAAPDLNPTTMNVSAALGVRRAITNTAKLDIYVSGNQSLSPISSGPLERRFRSVGMFISIMNSF
jgi:hypothetical protein